jgi:hypothetical protein
MGRTMRHALTVMEENVWMYLGTSWTIEFGRRRTLHVLLEHDGSSHTLDRVRHISYFFPLWLVWSLIT